MVRLTIEVPEDQFEMLVGLAERMRGRGLEITPEQLTPALLRLGLRAAAVEAVGTAAEKFDLSIFTPEEWDQMDSALAKLLRSAAGAS